MNTPVNFEIAKLLRLKSFKDPCFYYYMETGKLCEPYLENGSSTDVDFRVDLTDLLDDSNSKYTPTTYSAPTIGDVVMWLYEKHGIWIEVSKYRDHAADCNDDYSFKHNYSGSTTFKTPTEAYSSAILYILNNLVCK